MVDDGCTASRLPRWTRQEILVLIQGKKLAENRVRRGRMAGLGLVGSGGGPVGVGLEPKWASVSSYCKKHGVNRGPLQCRKRWSNLAGDFKKIKDWESQIKEESSVAAAHSSMSSSSSSFWVMRNDLRRERKLPGFFDREVYDILDGAVGVGGATATPLALALPPIPPKQGKVEEEKGDCTEGTLFDSGRSAAVEDGLFSDFESSMQEAAATATYTFTKEAPQVPTIAAFAPIPISGTTKKQQPSLNHEMGSNSHQEGRKRKQPMTDGDGEIETTCLHDQLIKVLERNGRMLGAQLEAQQSNCQLDREQRRELAISLVSVLNKLSDALGRIAAKL